MSEKLVKEATEFRDEIPEIEGLLISKLDGTKLWGDTLKDLNHDFILSSTSVVVKATKKVSESIEKKAVKMIEIEIEGGFAIILTTTKGSVVAFFGEDARSQLGIIKKNLKTFLAKIEPHL